MDKGLGTLVEAYLLLRANGRNPRLKLCVAGAQTTADVPYVAKTGTLPLLKEDGATRADVFFVYYAATGADGLAFIDACLESTRTGGWADCRHV